MSCAAAGTTRHTNCLKCIHPRQQLRSSQRRPNTTEHLLATGRVAQRTEKHQYELHSKLSYVFKHFISAMTGPIGE